MKHTEETKRKIGENSKRWWQNKRDNGEIESHIAYIRGLKTPRTHLKCGHQYWDGNKYSICDGSRKRNETMCDECRVRPHKERATRSYFCSKYNEDYCININW